LLVEYVKSFVNSIEPLVGAKARGTLVYALVNPLLEIFGTTLWLVEMVFQLIDLSAGFIQDLHLIEVCIHCGILAPS
jgi:hypothetical protein